MKQPVLSGRTHQSFHEIRHLGAALLKEAGGKTEEIQALMGHSAPAMTVHYLNGHDLPWKEVPSGASLGLVR